MFHIPPKSLQNAMIFYISCVILVTNGFFAIITFSRENISAHREQVGHGTFLGYLLQSPARQLLRDDNPAGIERVMRERPSSLSEVLVTIYDLNWWAKWGEPERPPPEGFPVYNEMKQVVTRSGFPGKTSQEIFFPVKDGKEIFGTIGIGVPLFVAHARVESGYQVLLTLLVNLGLGVALAVFIAQIILRPLLSLMDGIEGIKGGNYSLRVQVVDQGEMRALGEMFNRMASTLEEKLREGAERTRILDEKVQELWEIYDLTKEMGFSLNLDQILERFLERAQMLSFSSYGQILLVGSEEEKWELQASSKAFPLISRDVYEKSLRDCLEKGEILEKETNGHILLLVPLISGRLVQGVLFLAKKGTKSYSEGITRFLETIAPLGGSLVENAQLYQHVVEMRNYIRNVLNSVDAGVATLDERYRLITVNAAFGRLLNIPELEAARQPFTDILAPVFDKKFQEELITTLKDFRARLIPENSVQGIASEDSRQSQLTMQTETGEHRVFQVRITPLNAGDSVIGQVLVLDDLTNLKIIEKRMLESEKWAVLGRLAASVAHEIRNPLVAIRSLVEIIGEEVEGDSQTHVKVVLGEVHRLNRVAEELLNLSKPEKTHLQKVNLPDLLDESLILVKHEAHRHKVSIHRAWSDQEKYVKIDPEKMKQAFLNIMLNAVQAMPTGGDLKVQTLDLGLAEVAIDFTDTGPGIDEKVLRQMFDPFFTTRPHGSGLGLAISRKILGLHGGRIEVNTVFGQGTTFRCVIPTSIEELI